MVKIHTLYEKSSFGFIQTLEVTHINQLQTGDMVYIQRTVGTCAGLSFLYKATSIHSIHPGDINLNQL